MAGDKSRSYRPTVRGCASGRPFGFGLPRRARKIVEQSLAGPVYTGGLGNGGPFAAASPGRGIRTFFLVLKSGRLAED